MADPKDMTLSVEAGPKGLSVFLAEIATFFADETKERGGDVVLPRFVAKLFVLGFRDAGYRAEAFEETAAVCGRLEATVRIQQAEIDRLKAQLATRTARPHLRPVDGAGVVVDMSETFAREQAVTRGVGPTGGDVA